MLKEFQSASDEKSRNLSIQVIGLGGAGINAASHMAQSDLRELKFQALHTNARSLAHVGLENRVLFGLDMMRGLGTGGDPDLGRAAAEEEFEKLKEVCAGTDLLFIVAGLGGGTATGAAPVLARAARETGALVLAIVTLPFEFEGARRQRQAQAGFQELRSAADGVICLPHQKVSALIDENTSLLETFSITHEMLAQGVRGIWQMLTRQGLINVDFSDLCSVLRGRQAESCFVAAEARGENRAREVVDKLLASPLLDQGQALAEADAVLVSVIGGPDLTMAEVNRVMERINRQTENAQLIMGAAILPESEGAIGVTLVASRRGRQAGADLSVNPDNRLSQGPELAAAASEMENPFFGAPAQSRSAPRYVAPPPNLSAERKEQLYARQSGSGGGRSKSGLRWLQGQLPLEIVSKGRFEKSEPTLHQGEDLDVPTYIRRGIALN
ncbi:MAG: cell division FtsZ family protein [Verrucomicrobia bacterium]|nr:cell division FtsZ family protein [Verrucomicrobiota bacterium]